jgi:hypothetical protein
MTLVTWPWSLSPLWIATYGGGGSRPSRLGASRRWCAAARQTPAQIIKWLGLGSDGIGPIGRIKVPGGAAIRENGRSERAAKSRGGPDRRCVARA